MKKEPNKFFSPHWQGDPPACDSAPHASDLHPDHDLDSYLYDLPPQLIAQDPKEKRAESRLLVLNKNTGELCDTCFSKITEFLPPRSLVVMNNTAVLPARLLGTKHSGGRAEFLLLTPLGLIRPRRSEEPGRQEAEVHGLIKTSRARPGTLLVFGTLCTVRLLTPLGFGRWKVRITWKGELENVFQTMGHVPLPPYIQREDKTEDHSRYQTVYARREKLGSVAAPTAGLHFTPEMLSALHDRGIQTAEVTLYVGYGTFSPVRTKDVRKHCMHEEFVEVTPETAQAVNQAREEKRPLVAVGTTSVRTLESAVGSDGRVIPMQGWTGKYITPGYRFQVIDHLITNFHLPGSSLILLVASLAGRVQVLEAYAHAVRQGYRFFSYGDAMLVL